jgi:hypothetical protein
MSELDAYAAIGNPSFLNPRRCSVSVPIFTISSHDYILSKARDSDIRCHRLDLYASKSCAKSDPVAVPW